MLALNKISKIGNGLYRMSINNSEHLNTLVYSINKGYNLIDTSTTYLNGESELLVGKLLKENKDLSDKVFIISKAGYVSGDLPLDMDKFINSPSSETAFIDNESPHCIHPNYIEFQFEACLKRINRDYVDCFLIHNPERYLKSMNKNSKNLVYELLTSCFELLEKKVKKGKLRYYGISCNSITSPKKEDHLDFLKLTEIVETENKNHHFKFLQFPYNFFEQDAKEKNYENKSLIEIAKTKKVKLIGNRPFYMDDKGMVFQLVSYEKFYKDKIIDPTIVTKLFNLVDAQIKLVTDNESTANDIEIMAALKKGWDQFQTKESVSQFFNQHLTPFLKAIFEQIPTKISTLSEELKKLMILCAYKNITKKSTEVMQKLVKEGVEEKETLALTAVNNYINTVGLNHVLIGMRKNEYVDDFKNNFDYP